MTKASRFPRTPEDIIRMGVDRLMPSALLSHAPSLMLPSAQRTIVPSPMKSLAKLSTVYSLPFLHSNGDPIGTNHTVQRYLTPSILTEINVCRALGVHLKNRQMVHSPSLSSVKESKHYILAS
ncbi:hypothetical protein BaRGS_00019190 [Batillaria attramentaria]|uniref:Uncharacterized protein n=1 Tax=Batillaria attramentaria TaxID=370345 RepID=A0ABD0KR39_9CAEN